MAQISVGIVTGAHGVQGVIKVKPLSDNIDRFAPGGVLSYSSSPERGASTQLHIRTSSVNSHGMLLLGVEEVTTREHALALKGIHLSIAEQEVPSLTDPDSYYHYQLVGLTVYLVGGGYLAEVVQVLEKGGEALLELVNPDWPQPKYLPFVKDLVPTVDLTAGYLIADPPAGLLEGQ